MKDQLRGTTAIIDGVVDVPGNAPVVTPPADSAATGGKLPPNKPNDDQAITSPNGAMMLAPDSTGPPNTNDYWFGLIPEKTAADFLGMTPRWMQAKRQLGGGPKFVRISQRCIRYTRFSLKIYADDRLRSSTSDQGETTHAA